MTDCIIRSNLHGTPQQVWEICKMASANSRVKTFAQAASLSTSLTLMGKASIKGLEGASHGFRSVAPWKVEPIDVYAWMQRIAESHTDGLRSYRMRDGRVVEVAFSFA
jgi:hypothetical protein